MKIKTGRVRRLYDEALDNNIISANMLLMSVAALNNEIQYNNKLYNKTVANYTTFRNQLAKTAIQQGISKNKISEITQTLSPDRYPSYNQIIKLITLLQNDYNYVVDYIPDSDMKYRTATELQELSQQKVIHRNQNIIEQESLFNEICDTISNSFYIFPITADMQTKLRKIKASNDIVLQAFKWYSGDIHKAMNKKHFDNSYDKFCYIVGVLSKKTPNTIANIERQKKQQEEFWNDNAKAIIKGDETVDSIIVIQCDKYPNSVYYGQHNYVRKQLLHAIEEIKKSNGERQRNEQQEQKEQI